MVGRVARRHFEWGGGGGSGTTPSAEDFNFELGGAGGGMEDECRVVGGFEGEDDEEGE